MQSEQLYSRPIFQSDQFQVRLTINVFRGVQYLHLRRYYLDMDQQWRPSKQGISMPLTLSNSKQLFTGLAQIMSMAEKTQIIQQYLAGILGDID